MKIAIIDDNNEHAKLIKSSIEHQQNWSVDFFNNAKQFGIAKLELYDVIIAKYGLPTTNGRDLIKSISNKTNAELFLMSSSHNFVDEDIDNENIAGLIDMSDANNIVDQLKYIDVKIRINKSIKVEEEKFGKASTSLSSSCYSLEHKDEIIIIGIKDVLSQDIKDKIIKEINSTKKYKGIIFFPNRVIVPSSFLAELTYFYKQFKIKKGLLAFWNITKSPSMTELLRTCNLDKLFHIFDDLDEAINYLKKH